MPWDKTTAIAIGLLIASIAMHVEASPSCVLMSDPVPSPAVAMSECAPALTAIALTSVGLALTVADLPVRATLSIFIAAAPWMIGGTAHCCA